MLLAAGAQVELATRQRRYKTCGWTPLMLAAHHGHVEVIKRLLAAGTDFTLVHGLSAAQLVGVARAVRVGARGRGRAWRRPRGAG